MPFRWGRLRDTDQPVVYRTRAYAFVAVCALAILIFFYTNSLIRRLEAQSATLSRSIAGLCATATYEARENETLRVIFSELIEAINFPIVISDVRGIPITDYCDQHHLTTNDRLRLFASVLHAVQHAHHKGIIHRDLKPENVAIDSFGQVIVIDWGIAKLIDDVTAGEQVELLVGRDGGFI